MTNDLRIADAPLLVDVSGEEKIPTGGYGNYSTTINQIADFTQLKWKLATEGYVDDEINKTKNLLETHSKDDKNPHNVKKEQIGLSEVDNTADIDKPVSTYQKLEIDKKVAKTSIVDNLTTNESTKVLSAKQGKLLQDTKANKTDVYTKDESLVLIREDQYVITESGRTQREKNKDFVTSADFGILPNTAKDQTDKFDIFFDYLRTNKIKGYVLSGNYVVSPNKRVTLDGVTVNYCLNVSGLDIEGAFYGYKSANGSVFTMNSSNTVSENDVVMLQTSYSVANISPKIKGFLYKNAQTCIRLPYVVHGEFSHLYAGTDCVNGIILGDFSLAAGPLFNKFEHINITVSGKGLDVRGKDYVNANVFENFYISGGVPSSINCTGGYGAIANKFIGGEFASKSDTGTAGIELTRTRSTTFDGTYFEAHGHAIVLNQGNGDLMLINPIFGTTKKSRCESEQPSFIHQRGGSPNTVILNGGSVFIGTSDEQKDMRLFTTTDASNLTLVIQKNPSVVTSNTGYKVMDYNVFRSLSVFQGVYREVLSVPFSTAGGIITGLPSTSTMEVTVSNRLCNVNFRVDYDVSAVYEEGDYYIQLPRSTAGDNVPLGVLRVSKPSTNDYYDGYLQPLTSGNCGMRYYLHTGTVGVNNQVAIKTSQPLINKSFMESLGTGGFVKGNISYYL